MNPKFPDFFEWFEQQAWNTDHDNLIGRAAFHICGHPLYHGFGQGKAWEATKMDSVIRSNRTSRTAHALLEHFWQCKREVGEVFLCTTPEQVLMDAWDMWSYSKDVGFRHQKEIELEKLRQSDIQPRIFHLR